MNPLDKIGAFDVQPRDNPYNQLAYSPKDSVIRETAFPR